MKAFSVFYLLGIFAFGAVDTAKLNELGLQIEESMANHDPSILYHAIDQDALITRIRALGLKDQTDEEMKQYISALLKSELVDTLKSMGENGYYDYVGVNNRDGETYAVFRLITNQFDYNYHEFPVIEKEGQLKFSDRFMVNMDALFSTMYFYDAAFQKENSLEIILGEVVSPEEKAAVMAFLEAMSKQDPKGAMSAFETMPVSARKVRFFLAAYLGAAMSIDAESAARALDIYHGFYPESVTVLRHSITHLVDQKQYEQAIKALDQLDRRIGGDPYLILQQAITYKESGDTTKAKALAMEALGKDSHLSDAYDLLGGLYVDEKDYDQAVAVYGRMEEVFGGLIPIDTFMTRPENKDFSTSEAFKKWKKDQILEYKVGQLCIQIEADLAKGNANTLVDAFHVETFRNRMLAAGADQALMEAAGYTAAGTRAKLMDLLKGLSKSASYRFLHLLHRDNALYAIFRNMPSADKIDYHEFLVLAQDGKVYFADLNDILLGYDYSWFHTNNEALSRPNNSPLVQKLLGGPLTAELAADVEKFIALLNQDKHTEALAAYEALPEKIRTNGAMMTAYSTASAQAGGESLGKALEYLEKNHAPESMIDILSLGYLMNLGQWKESMVPLEDLEKRIGGDTALTHLKAMVLMQQGEVAQARNLVVSLIEQEPENQDHYNTLANILLKSNDFKNAVMVLRTAEQKFGAIDLDQFRKLPEMAEFVASEPFRNWAEEKAKK